MGDSTDQLLHILGKEISDYLKLNHQSSESSKVALVIKISIEIPASLISNLLSESKRWETVCKIRNVLVLEELSSPYDFDFEADLPVKENVETKLSINGEADQEADDVDDIPNPLVMSPMRGNVKPNSRKSKHVNTNTKIRKRRAQRLDKLRSKCLSSFDKDLIEKNGVNFQCVACNKTFQNRRQGSLHLRQYHGSNKTKLFSCNVCDLSFCDKKKYSAHRKTHVIDKHFKCKTCDKILKTRIHHQHHMLIHGGIRDHKCNKCDRAFFNVYALRKHEKTHSGEKPFTCNICTKSFTSKNYLEKHISLHSGAKKSQCHICGKTFTTAYNLSNHVRIHTGEKPYTCDVCGKSFTEKSTLRKHIKTHSNEKPHTCNMCPSSFRFRSTLVEHLRIHTGERPYKCDVCGKSFKHYSSRNKHKRIHVRDLETPFEDYTGVPNWDVHNV